MTNNFPLPEDVLKILTANLKDSIYELIELANTITSILSSIAKLFEIQSHRSIISNLVTKVYQCLELSQQYKDACINVAALGSCESSFRMLKEQLAKGIVSCLRKYVNDIQEALVLCDICFSEVSRAFEQTKTDIRCAITSTQGKITASETGIKDSAIATVIGGAVMSSSIVLGIPLAFIAPPIGLSMIVAGAAGAATLTGGALGLGVHRFNKKQQTEILVQIQTLNECLNSSKRIIDKLEGMMTSTKSDIDHIDRCRGRAEQRQKLTKIDMWQIDRFLDHTYHNLGEVQKINSM